MLPSVLDLRSLSPNHLVPNNCPVVYESASDNNNSRPYFVSALFSPFRLLPPCGVMAEKNWRNKPHQLPYIGGLLGPLFQAFWSTKQRTPLYNSPGL